MKTFDSKTQILILVNLLLLFLALFVNIDLLPFNMEEPRRAIVAMEMENSGNYVVPKIFGFNYLNKPPVFNWYLILFKQIFGCYSETMCRTASIFSLLLLGIANYHFIKKFVEKEWAIISSFIILTCSHILFYFSLLGEIDIFYTLLTYLQIILLYQAFNKKSTALYFVLSYFFCALGLLTKGLPSIAFQGLTVILFIIYYKKYSYIIYTKHLLGVFVFLSITIGYFALYHQYEDVNPFLINLFNESSTRLSNEEIPLIIHLLTFPLMLLQIALPWTLLLIFLVKKDVRLMIKNNQLLLISILFILVNCVLYWIAPLTRPRYLFIFIPFMSYILIFILKWWKDEATVKFKPSIYSILIVVSLLLISRIIFDFTVIPHRAKNHLHNEHKVIAKKLAEFSNNQPIYLTGGIGKEEKKWTLPILKNIPPSIHKGTAIFHYNLSLYFYEITRSPLLYQKKFKEDQLYLAPDWFYKEELFEEIYRFNEPSFNYNYVLFKPKK